MILYRRVVQYIIILEFRRLSTLLQDQSMSNGFSKTKSFCFENSFFIHGTCMCEGVDEDSRHGAWHVVIHVEMCMFLLECVWMCEHGIACALRWGVALVGDFLC